MAIASSAAAQVEAALQALSVPPDVRARRDDAARAGRQRRFAASHVGLQESARRATARVLGPLQTAHLVSMAFIFMRRRPCRHLHQARHRPRHNTKGQLPVEKLLPGARGPDPACSVIVQMTTFTASLSSKRMSSHSTRAALALTLGFESTLQTT